jgi:4-hydroxyphenylacetate decarboxylase small subunit
MEMFDMGIESSAHRDCRNFAPLDVAKGICHLTGDVVTADDRCCPNLALLERCRICMHFAPDEGNVSLGICLASRNRFMAYGEMTSLTCENYQKKPGQ